MGRQFSLALTQENMHMQRVSHSLDTSEHACTWRESGESSTNAYP